MPTNHALATLIRRLGTMLELDGQARSRNRNLRAAADAIDALDHPVTLADLAEGGALNLGEEPAEVLDELLRTGASKLQHKLAMRYPEGLVEIVEVPGIGAARALLMWEDLGIGSLEELVEVGQTGRLTEVKGIGAKSAEKILDAAREMLAARADAAAKALADEPAPPAEAGKVPAEEATAEDEAQPTHEAPEAATEAAAEPEAAVPAAAAPTTAAIPAMPAATLPLADVIAEFMAEERSRQSPPEARSSNPLDDVADETPSDLDDYEALSESVERGELDAKTRALRIIHTLSDGGGQGPVTEAPKVAAAPAPVALDGAAAFWHTLRCAACQHVGMEERGGEAVCPSCGRRFPAREGILDFVGSRPSHRSLFQRLMEFGPYSTIYERFSRPAFTRALARRSLENEIALSGELLGLTPGMKVLDVACGPGTFTRAFAEQLDGHRESLVVGLDLSWPMLEQAVGDTRRHGFSRVRFVRGDATRLPFGDGTFEGLHCGAALHLMPDIDAVLAEFGRVIVPGGRVVIGTFLQGRNVAARTVRKVAGRVTGMHWFGTAELRQRLSVAGLVVVDESISGDAITIAATRSA